MKDLDLFDKSLLTLYDILLCADNPANDESYQVTCSPLPPQFI